MASPAELARSIAGYDDAAVQQMQALFRSWALLADLGLGDALLLAPMVERPDNFVVLANVRPSTAPTLYSHDPLGDVHRAENRPFVAEAWSSGDVCSGTVTLGPTFPAGEARVEAARLRLGDDSIGVVLRERRVRDRPLLQLEQTYSALADRLMQMISDGVFPFRGTHVRQYGAPRVGDGLLVLDHSQRITFQSPNAVSALHRLGTQRTPLGRRLHDIGVDDSFIRSAYAMQKGVSQEQEHGHEVTVTGRCIPLVENGEVDGGFVLLRDISELKSRDRLLISKDATIREIHHRVKNNLQTISSLLRLQARRLESDEAKDALGESVRRIAAIAIVHETLANDATDEVGDAVSFIDVARPLIRLIEEGLQSPENPIEFVISGDPGRLSLIRSQPLAVVLTELLQNVVDHAFPEGWLPAAGKRVEVHFGIVEGHVEVTVVDNGVGPRDDFDFAESRGLGLTLVHTFVTGELGGTIEMTNDGKPPPNRGARTTIRFPQASADRVAEPSVDA